MTDNSILNMVGGEKHINPHYDIKEESANKGFTGIEVNGVRFSNIQEMLVYMDKQRNEIILLGKENAELKEVHESDKRSLALIAKKGADFEKAYNEAEELLDKQIEATYKVVEENKEAKEIIKKFSEFANLEVEYDTEHPQEHTDLWNELCKEAEQFLKKSVKR